jgi:hypothetical protein
MGGGVTCTRVARQLPRSQARRRRPPSTPSPRRRRWRRTRAVQSTRRMAPDAGRAVGDAGVLELLPARPRRSGRRHGKFGLIANCSRHRTVRGVTVRPGGHPACRTEGCAVVTADYWSTGSGEDQPGAWQALLSDTHLPGRIDVLERRPGARFEAWARRSWIHDLARVDCECSGSVRRPELVATDGDWWSCSWPSPGGRRSSRATRRPTCAPVTVWPGRAQRPPGSWCGSS